MDTKLTNEQKKAEILKFLLWCGSKNTVHLDGVSAVDQYILSTANSEPSKDE